MDFASLELALDACPSPLGRVVEHVVESFEAFVGSHSRCGDLILLDAIDFGRGRQNEIEF